MSAQAWETDPGRRNVFFRQLQQLTNPIHATRHVDEIMLDLSAGICSLFGADRLSIYVVGEDEASLVSKVKTGLSSFRQLRLPISALSVAVAFAQRRSEQVRERDGFAGALRETARASVRARSASPSAASRDCLDGGIFVRDRLLGCGRHTRIKPRR